MCSVRVGTPRDFGSRRSSSSSSSSSNIRLKIADKLKYYKSQQKEEQRRVFFKNILGTS